MRWTPNEKTKGLRTIVAALLNTGFYRTVAMVAWYHEGRHGGLPLRVGQGLVR
jgi:hypothetical protein